MPDTRKPEVPPAGLTVNVPGPLDPTWLVPVPLNTNELELVAIAWLPKATEPGEVACAAVPTEIVFVPDHLDVGMFRNENASCLSAMAPEASVTNASACVAAW